MKTEVITITPEIAADMLAASNGNRPLKQAKVNSYARDMAAGKWSLNGETIIVDVSGALVDGHHRMKACIASGVSFQALVVTGAPLDAQITVDMGASRTASDALHFYGYRNTNNLVSIVRVLLSMDAGRARSANPSTQETFQFIEENPLIHSAATFASSAARGMPKIASVLGAIYFLESAHGGASRVTEFAEVMATGIPAYSGCAAHALRERLFRDERSAAKLSVADRQLLIVAAWEKFKIAAPVKTLKAKSVFNIVGMDRKKV